jgi:riboflavin transporter FmnP
VNAEGQQSPKVGNVIGGVVLGLVAAVGYMIVAFITAYGLDPSGSGSGVVWVLLFVAPAVVGAILLAVPRTRRSGAGLVIGLAVGLIVVPAMCVSPLLGG